MELEKFLQMVLVNNAIVYLRIPIGEILCKELAARYNTSEDYIRLAFKNVQDKLVKKMKEMS
jgi:hypothetical protein